MKAEREGVEKRRTREGREGLRVRERRGGGRGKKGGRGGAQGGRSRAAFVPLCVVPGWSSLHEIPGFIPGSVNLSVTE